MPHRSERPWAYRILEKRDTATAISPRSSTRRDSVCTGSIQRRRTAVAKKSIVLSDPTDPSTHGISQAAEPHQCWIARPDPIGPTRLRLKRLSRRIRSKRGGRNVPIKEPGQFSRPQSRHVRLGKTPVLCMPVSHDVRSQTPNLLCTVPQLLRTGLGDGFGEDKAVRNHFLDGSGMWRDACGREWLLTPFPTSTLLVSPFRPLPYHSFRFWNEGQLHNDRQHDRESR